MPQKYNISPFLSLLLMCAADSDLFLKCGYDSSDCGLRLQPHQTDSVLHVSSPSHTPVSAPTVSALHESAIFSAVPLESIFTQQPEGALESSIPA